MQPELTLNPIASIKIENSTSDGGNNEAVIRMQRAMVDFGFPIFSRYDYSKLSVEFRNKIAGWTAKFCERVFIAEDHAAIKRIENRFGNEAVASITNILVYKALYEFKGIKDPKKINGSLAQIYLVVEPTYRGIIHFLGKQKAYQSEEMIKVMEFVRKKEHPAVSMMREIGADIFDYITNKVNSTEFAKKAIKAKLIHEVKLELRAKVDEARPALLALENDEHLAKIERLEAELQSIASAEQAEIFDTFEFYTFIESIHHSVPRDILLKNSVNEDDLAQHPELGIVVNMMECMLIRVKEMHNLTSVEPEFLKVMAWNQFRLFFATAEMTVFGDKTLWEELNKAVTEPTEIFDKLALTMPMEQRQTANSVYDVLRYAVMEMISDQSVLFAAPIVPRNSRGFAGRQSNAHRQTQPQQPEPPTPTRERTPQQVNLPDGSRISYGKPGFGTRWLFAFDSLPGIKNINEHWKLFKIGNLLSNMTFGAALNAATTYTFFELTFGYENFGSLFHMSSDSFDRFVQIWTGTMTVYALSLLFPEFRIKSDKLPKALQDFGFLGETTYLVKEKLYLGNAMLTDSNKKPTEVFIPGDIAPDGTVIQEGIVWRFGQLGMNSQYVPARGDDPATHNFTLSTVTLRRHPTQMNRLVAVYEGVPMINTDLLGPDDYWPIGLGRSFKNGFLSFIGKHKKRWFFAYPSVMPGKKGSHQILEPYPNLPKPMEVMTDKPVMVDVVAPFGGYVFNHMFNQVIGESKLTLKSIDIQTALPNIAVSFLAAGFSFIKYGDITPPAYYKYFVEGAFINLLLPALMIVGLGNKVLGFLKGGSAPQADPTPTPESIATVIHDLNRGIDLGSYHLPSDYKLSEISRIISNTGGYYDWTSSYMPLDPDQFKDVREGHKLLTDMLQGIDKTSLKVLLFDYHDAQHAAVLKDSGELICICKSTLSY